MVYVSANDLKKKGVGLLDDIMKDKEEVIITVRGKSKYVVFDMEKYNKYRLYELESALIEARKDIENGNIIEENVDSHIERISET